MEAIEKKGILWNIVANMLVSMTNFIILIVIARVNGAEEVGLYSIAFAVVSLVTTLGLYNVRPFQITDISQNYRFKEYLVLRYMTLALMIVMVGVTLVAGEYSDSTQMVIVLLTINEIINTLSDVYQGEFQVRNRLDLASKTKVFRYTAYIIVFILTLSITRNLYLALIGAVGVNIIGFIGYDIRIYYKTLKDSHTVRLDKVKEIAIKCFPLFLSCFFSMYYLNAPKYAIDALMNEYIQGIYNMLYMITFVFNLLAVLITQPMMPYFASMVLTNHKKKFMKIVHGINIGIVVCVLIGVALSKVLLIPILSFVYSVDFAPYMDIFKLLLCVGGLQAINGVLQNGLLVLGRQKHVAFVNMLVCIVLYIISKPFVAQWGLMGATVVNVIAASLLVGVLYIIFCLGKKKQ